MKSVVDFENLSSQKKNSEKEQNKLQIDERWKLTKRE